MIRRGHLIGYIAIVLILVVVDLVIWRSQSAREVPAERPSGQWAQVSAGARHTCALGAAGKVVCWSGDASAVTDPPQDMFASISSGGSHGCGVTTGGLVRCWGPDFQGSTRAPAGKFVEVSAGWDYACGIRAADQKVACWGWNKQGQATPPDGAFASLAAGYTHTCGIKTDRSVACWGANDQGQADAPAGPFVQVVVGQCHSCALGPGGAASCWGCNPAEDKKDPQTGEVVGSWRRNSPPKEVFKALSAGYMHTCGLKRDGTMRCWGHNSLGQSKVRAGVFSGLSAGFFHTCGVRGSGRLECWGWQIPVGATPWAAAQGTTQQSAAVGGPVMDPALHTCPFQGLGMLYLSQQREDLALQNMNMVSRLNPSIEYRKYLAMAKLLMRQGKHQRAKELLIKARDSLKLAPRYKPAQPSRHGVRTP